MKDRQFMTVLALVVAAGLVMGLIAFRVTGGAARTSAPSAVVLNNGAPHPSAADEVADQPVDATPTATEVEGTKSAEPTTPTTEPPEMQGPADGDPPGTAAVATAPSAPAPNDTIQ